MTVHQIKNASARIGQVACALEEAYNGGEVTAGSVRFVKPKAEKEA